MPLLSPDDVTVIPPSTCRRFSGHGPTYGSGRVPRAPACATLGPTGTHREGPDGRHVRAGTGAARDGGALAGRRHGHGDPRRPRRVLVPVLPAARPGLGRCLGAAAARRPARAGELRPGAAGCPRLPGRGAGGVVRGGAQGGLPAAARVPGEPRRGRRGLVGELLRRAGRPPTPGRGPGAARRRRRARAAPWRGRGRGLPGRPVRPALALLRRALPRTARALPRRGLHRGGPPLPGSRGRPAPLRLAQVVVGGTAALAEELAGAAPGLRLGAVDLDPVTVDV